MIEILIAVFAVAFAIPLWFILVCIAMQISKNYDAGIWIKAGNNCNNFRLKEKQILKLYEENSVKQNRILRFLENVNFVITNEDVVTLKIENKEKLRELLREEKNNG